MGRLSAYRVQYWKSNAHNAFYYDEYLPALRKYAGWALNQMLESDGAVDKVRFEELGADGEYHPIFESLAIDSPAAP